MRLLLGMVTADGGERTFPLAGDRTVLGRDTRCDLRVAVPTVSSRHCEIVTGDGGALVLNDLGSETGTFHNGSRVERAELSTDDRFTIGSVTFVVRAEPARESPDEAGNTVAEVKPDPQPSPGRSRPATT